ncbi:MAG: ATP-binding protein [Fibrobacter sp.]|nr:ATP-binding protein [Fibrobacter sp.]
MQNPFIVKGYHGKDYFCDRKRELSEMLLNIKNRVDMTLISPRRMGKTGLIHRFFDELKLKKTGITPLYVDIYATTNLADFVKAIVEASFSAFHEKKGVGKRLTEFLKSLRPTISFDSLTGLPQIQINYQNISEKEASLKNVLEFLDSQGTPIILAIDEFQQIDEYPEKNMEHLLRTYIQSLKNVNFIFCGSRQHLMLDMFANVKRPFYSSTKLINLDKIENVAYSHFIEKLFAENKRSIDSDALEFILSFTRLHTYYTQSLCHSLFASEEKSITIGTVKKSCNDILESNAPIYLQYRQLLTADQWNYLIAVAKEGSVSQVTSGKFLKNNGIASAAASKRLLTALCNKELLMKTVTKENTEYSVYDVFFSRWLEKEYH